MEPLLSKTSHLSFIRFLDQDRFVYREGRNLFLYQIKNGSVTQLTDLMEGNKPKKTKSNFYRQEERKMFQYIDNLYHRDDNYEEQAETNRHGKPAETREGLSG